MILLYQFLSSENVTVCDFDGPVLSNAMFQCLNTHVMTVTTTFGDLQNGLTTNQSATCDVCRYVINELGLTTIHFLLYLWYILWFNVHACYLAYFRYSSQTRILKMVNVHISWI